MAGSGVVIGGSGDGAQGPPGPAGADAYQVALNNGFVGTDQEWLDSLEGAQGIQGLKGDTGDTGPQGIQGIPGVDGSDGIDGADGLQGIQGVPGTDGADGAQGIPGNDGADGTNGIDGSDGAQGIPGNDGLDGADGNTILTLAGPPTAGDGVDGDYAIWQDLPDTYFIYGPKVGGVWPAGVNLLPVQELFDRILSSDSPLERLNALEDMTANALLAPLDNNNYPKLVREESGGFLTSVPDNPVPGQAHRMLKWRRVHTQTGGKSHAAGVQAQHPEMVYVNYFQTTETQYSGSPYFKTGTGGRYSHQQYYDGFGQTTVGGNPPGGLIGSDNGGAADTNWDLCPAHLQVGTSVTVTVNPGALTGPADTKVYTVTGDTSGFVVGGGCIIYSPDSGGATWADEEGTGSPWSLAEYCEVKAKTATTISVGEAIMGNGTRFKSMGGGGSVNHNVNSRIVMVGTGQIPNDLFNFRFNNSTLAPRDAAGLRWNEFNAIWMHNNGKINSSGGAVVLNMPLSATDVNDDHLSQSYHHDINGDGIRDDNYVNGVNELRAGMIDAIVKLKAQPSLNVPYQPGGVEESALEGESGHQVEHIASSAQGADDQNVTYDKLASKAYRAAGFENVTGSLRFFSSILNKDSAKYHKTDTSSATQNNAIVAKLALSCICGTALALKDLTISDPDGSWMEWASVIGDPDNIPGGYSLGDVIPNTDANQNLINQHFEWLGEPESDIFNISGVDVDALPGAQKVVDYDFSDPATVDELGWELVGAVVGATLAYNGATKALRVSNIDAQVGWGTTYIRSPICLSSAEDGKDYVNRITYRSNCLGVSQNQIGSNNVHNELLYAYPGRDNVVSLSGQFAVAPTEFDEATWANLVKLRMEIVRMNQPGVANPWYELVRNEVFTGTDIRNTAYGRIFKNGIAVMNATGRTITYALGGDYIVPNTSALHDITWLTPGATINSVTIPDNCGALLVKAANNRDVVSRIYTGNNENILCVNAGQGVNYGEYINLSGVKVTPTVTTDLTTCP